MDITQLRYFLKTAKTLNYTRAAKALFITRQSLRQAIASIEAELGSPLFYNERNHLSLTECGAYLALTGAKVVRAFDDMWTDTTRMAIQPLHLKAAFSESLVPFLLPGLSEIFQRFQARFPHISLELFRWDMDRVIEAAEAGEIDCGCVLRMPCEHLGCSVQVLQSFPASLDYSDAFPHVEKLKKGFSLEMLEGIPCIGMGSLRRYAQPVWEDCLSRGIHPDYQVIPNTIDAFYRVQNGLAISFDILDNGELGNRPIYSCPLPVYTFELVLICPSSRSERGPVELLRTFLEQEVGSHFNTPST